MYNPVRSPLIESSNTHINTTKCKRQTGVDTQIKKITKIISLSSSITTSTYKLIPLNTFQLLMGSMQTVKSQTANSIDGAYLKDITPTDTPT